MLRKFALSFVCFLVMPAFMSVSALVTDLSHKRIEIRYSFNGADLILFGAVGNSGAALDQDTFDIVVVVRGPERHTVLRRKDKIGVIWLNNEKVIFPSAPGYYAVAATRPLADIASAKAFESYGIGFDYLPLRVETSSGLAAPTEDFRKALYRLRDKDGLYRQEKDTVSHIAEGLFRTDVHLPSNVPVGDFIVETFLFQKGELKARNRIAMNVDKEGFERTAYSYAHNYPFWYGLTAVLVALCAGWLAGLVSRRK